jgi:hypothetical protein
MPTRCSERSTAGAADPWPRSKVFILDSDTLTLLFRGHPNGSAGTLPL